MTGALAGTLLAPEDLALKWGAGPRPGCEDGAAGLLESRVRRLSRAREEVYPLQVWTAVAFACRHRVPVAALSGLLSTTMARPWLACPATAPCPGCAARPQWCWVPRALYVLLDHLWQEAPGEGALPCASLEGPVAAVAAGLDLMGFCAYLESSDAPGSEWPRGVELWEQGSPNAFLADALTRTLMLRAAAGASELLPQVARVAHRAVELAPVLPDDIALRLRRRAVKATELARRSGSRPASGPVNRYAWC